MHCRFFCSYLAIKILLFIKSSNRHKFGCYTTVTPWCNAHIWNSMMVFLVKIFCTHSLLVTPKLWCIPFHGFWWDAWKSVEERMNIQAAQMIDVEGWFIITRPSSLASSLHPQGSHLLLTPHLPHIWLSQHMLTFSIVHPHSALQSCSSTALKSRTPFYFFFYHIIHTHTPALAAGSHSLSLFVLSSVEFVV